MVPWLKAVVALLEDLSLDPSAHILSSSQLSLTPAPRDPVPSFWPLWELACTHALKHTDRHISKYLRKCFRAGKMTQQVKKF